MSTFTVALYEPEIPPNTGNIIRLCANTQTKLALIEPLGFPLDDKRMIRAGLDYHELTHIQVHKDFRSFLDAHPARRIFACSTKATRLYHEVHYQPRDIFLFGPETRGLPSDVLTSVPEGHCIKIPMVPGSRSLNLSNAVAVILYEAWRQRGFVLEPLRPGL